MQGFFRVICDVVTDGGNPVTFQVFSEISWNQQESRSW